MPHYNHSGESGTAHPLVPRTWFVPRFEWSKENLRKDGLGNALDAKQIEIIVGDGYNGLQRQVLATYALEAQHLIEFFLGPYNVIHIGAAAPNIPSGPATQLSGKDVHSHWRLRTRRSSA